MPVSTKGVIQEFFPRSASATASKTQGFLFNNAPINKKNAKEEAKEKVASSKGNKRSAFVARLYQDDVRDSAEAKVGGYEQEMRVFDMDNSDVEVEKKRDIKIADK